MKNVLTIRIDDITNRQLKELIQYFNNEDQKHGAIIHKYNTSEIIRYAIQFTHNRFISDQNEI